MIVQTNPEGLDEMRDAAQSGFMLLGLIVAIFLVLLVLSAAAPTIATELKRDREVEAVHRGKEYVRAIQLYYRKNGHYPSSIELLENSVTTRFLRRRYADPLTGKDDWRLIPVGQNKTTLKGFFGKPLTGLPEAGLGSASDLVSGNKATAGSPTDKTSSNPGDSSAAGTAGTPSSPIDSQSAADFKGNGLPFMGVASKKAGDSILTLNEQTTYLTWEFIYDPRIEILKATNPPGSPP